MSTHDEESSKSKSSPSKFFSGLWNKAQTAYNNSKAESKRKKSFNDAGFVQLRDNLLTISETDFEKMEEYLENYHTGNYLVVDVGILRRLGCPDDKFIQSRLQFPPKLALSTTVAICNVVDRWWKADDDNLVIICCDGTFLEILMACLNFFSGKDTTALQGLHRYNVSSSNRIIAEFKKRTIIPSHKLFLKRFTDIMTFDTSFIVPELLLKELVIHKVPRIDHNGCYLMVFIIQGNRFLYSSVQHGGGIAKIPSTTKDPMTVSIPIGVTMKGAAIVKAYHVPKRVSTNNPRKFLFQLEFHTGVASLPGYKNRLMVKKKSIDQTANNPNYHKNFRVEFNFEDIVTDTKENLAKDEDKAMTCDAASETDSKHDAVADKKGSFGSEAMARVTTTTVTTTTTVIEIPTTPTRSDQVSSDKTLSQTPSPSTPSSPPSAQASSMIDMGNIMTELTLTPSTATSPPSSSPNSSPFSAPYGHSHSGLPVRASRNLPDNDLLNRSNSFHSPSISDRKTRNSESSSSSSSSHLDIPAPFNRSMSVNDTQIIRDDVDSVSAPQNDLKQLYTPTESTDDREMTQDEKDLEYARRLQAQFDAEVGITSPSSSTATSPSSGRSSRSRSRRSRRSGGSSTSSTTNTNTTSTSTIPVPPSSPEEEEKKRQMEADEAFARSLQQGFERQARRRSRRSDVHRTIRRHINSRGELDTSNMNYEALIDLQDYISSRGKKKRNGASAAMINQLPDFKCSGGRLLTEECTICQDNFKEGEYMRTLPCTHMYHRDCIDNWLAINKTCPLGCGAIDQAMNL